MEKIVYYDLATNKFIEEKKIRYLLFEFEIGDIYNNINDYKDGVMDLENQLDIVKSAIYDDIDFVINRLKRDWEVQIKKYKEVE